MRYQKEALARWPIRYNILSMGPRLRRDATALNTKGGLSPRGGSMPQPTLLLTHYAEWESTSVYRQALDAIFRMPLYPMLNQWNSNPITPNPGV